VVHCDDGKAAGESGGAAGIILLAVVSRATVKWDPPSPLQHAAERRGYAMARSLLILAFVAASVSITVATAVAQDVKVPEDLLIELERTACFGTCPVYSVTIDAKGNVTYEGFRFVRVGGRQRDRIPIARVAALLEAAERIRFFEMQDRYHAPVTDNPTTFVTIKSGGRSKRIEDYIAGPEELKQFQHLIDETARTKRWVSIDAEMLQQMIREGWSPSEKEKSARLIAALREDDVPVVKLLLDIGASPNETSDRGIPLMSVRSAAAARALLDAGANPFAALPHGTPLSRATYLPPDVADVLVKAGVPVDHPHDSDGRTALWSAACNGNAGVVSVLLKAGADPSVQVRGISALKCAQQGGARPPSRWMGKSPFVVDFGAVIALLEQASHRRREH
jgi:hypothetical protein